MIAQDLHRSAALAVLGLFAGLTGSCGRQAGNAIPLTGPAYVLTTEGAEDDVADVLLEILQEHMKPVRVSRDEDEPAKLGTIHAKMKVHGRTFTRKKEKAVVPDWLRATVTVTTYDGSSNWDGEHQIGFEVDGPISFSDAADTRRRYARKLLKVAVKQLPGRGAFQHDTLSGPPK